MQGLTYIRSLNNMTMQDVADVLGISKQLVGLWEVGNKKFPDKRLEELEKYFAIPKNYFQIMEISRMDELNIKKYYLQNEIEKNKTVYHENTHHNGTTIQECIDQSLSDLLENTKLDIEAEKLTSKIKNTLTKYEGKPNWISQKERILELFNRFTDVISQNDRNISLYKVLRGMETAFNVNVEKYQTWGAPDPTDECAITDDDPKVLGIKEILTSTQNDNHRDND